MEEFGKKEFKPYWIGWVLFVVLSLCIVSLYRGSVGDFMWIRVPFDLLLITVGTFAVGLLVGIYFLIVMFIKFLVYGKRD